MIIWYYLRKLLCCQQILCERNPRIEKSQRSTLTVDCLKRKKKWEVNGQNIEVKLWKERKGHCLEKCHNFIQRKKKVTIQWSKYRCQIPRIRKKEKTRRTWAYILFPRWFLWLINLDDQETKFVYKPCFASYIL